MLIVFNATMLCFICSSISRSKLIIFNFFFRSQLLTSLSIPINAITVYFIRSVYWNKILVTVLAFLNLNIFINNIGGMMMKFFKEWMLNLLKLIIIITSPVLCGCICYLLSVHIGIWTLYVILLMLISLPITIKI